MTRQRDGKSDWDTFSPRKRRDTMTAHKALYGGTERLTAEEFRALNEKREARARPVQVEDQHARILAARAHRHWWRHGWTRVEHRTDNWREAEQRQLQGAQTGMPDFWLFIPRMFERPCLRAVVELKAPQHKPKRVSGQWWLGEWPEGQGTWHALRRDQWLWLRRLDRSGFLTFVAYGHDEAEAWLVEVAGPRPAVLPEEW